MSEQEQPASGRGNERLRKALADPDTARRVEAIVKEMDQEEQAARSTRPD